MQKLRSLPLITLTIVLTVLFFTEPAIASITNGDFETASGWVYSEGSAPWSGAYDTSVFHGGLNSYRLTWPSGTGITGDYAKITQTIAVPGASRFYELDLWVKDDYPKGVRRYDYAYKQILVDNKVVWEDSVQGYEGEATNGWLHVVQDVTAEMMGKTQAVVALKVCQKAVVDKSIDVSMMLRTSLSAGSVDLGVSWGDVATWGILSATSPGAWAKRTGRIPILNGATQFRLWAQPYNFTGNVWVDDVYYTYSLDNPNPYLECGTDSLPDNWLNAGYGGTNVTITWDTSRYYSGAKSVKLYSLRSTGGGGIWTDWIPVTPGQVLDMSTMVYTEFTTGYFYFGVMFDTGDYRWAVSGVRSQNAWSLKSGKVTAPAGVKKFRLWAHATGDYGFGGSFWVDEVFVRRSLNSDFEKKVGNMPTNWVGDGYGTVTAALTTNYYSSASNSVLISGTNTTGGIWSDWINLLTNYPTGTMPGVNVWWDDVVLRTDKDTALETRRINVGYGLGNYAAQIYLTNGHLNTDAMITGLTNAHIRDFNYLIYNGLYDWADLPGFLDAAYTNGIRVWVGLVPPWETPSSKPYGYNFAPDDEDSDAGGYEANDLDGDNTDNWAYQIGQLSLSHPNLVGVYIDDFHGSGMNYPNLIGKMITTLHRINPAVAFMPCVYYADIAKCPQGWRTFGNDLSTQEGWVTNVCHSGTHSISISKAAVSGSPLWYGSPIYFSAPYPTNLTFGGWGKAQNVGANALCVLDFYITFDDNSTQWYWSNNTRFSNGTHDWEHKEDVVTFAKGVKSLLVYCLMYSDTGTVWYDDLYVMGNGTNLLYNPGLEAGVPTIDAALLPYLDGIVFPYVDLDSYAELPGQIDDIRQQLGTSKSLITMIYMNNASWHPAQTTLAYLEGAFNAAHNHSGNDGLQAYCLGMTNPTNTKYQLVQSLYGDWIYPSSWNTYYNDLDDESGWATDDYHSGIHSLKISKASADNAVWIGSPVTFTAPYPTNLTVGGWAMAENVGTNAFFGLGYLITLADDTTQWYWSNNTLFSAGTHDWEFRQDNLIFNIGIKNVAPYCMMYTATGTAWFDDLYISRDGTNVLANPGAETSR